MVFTAVRKFGGDSLGAIFDVSNFGFSKVSFCYNLATTVTFAKLRRDDRREIRRSQLLQDNVTSGTNIFGRIMVKASCAYCLNFLTQVIKHYRWVYFPSAR